MISSPVTRHSLLVTAYNVACHPLPITCHSLKAVDSLLKKVLIISYHFPPDAAVGAIRPAKFAKFLPEFGWEPIVYTVKDRYYESCDNSKLEPALQTLKIYRANLIPSPLDIYSRMVHKKNNSLNPPPHLQFVNKTTQGEVSSIKRFFSSLVRVPDDKQGWIVNIVMDGIRILRRHRIDTFVTSGPPMSTHVGGLLLKIMTQAKWVADFRDPWSEHLPWKGEGRHNRASDALEKWLEAQVVRIADRVISTTPSLTNFFRNIMQDHAKNKYVTITNGFDEDDYIGIHPTPLMGTSKIRITHTGTIYFNRNPESFFVALNGLMRNGTIHKEGIEIDLIGNCAYYGDVPVQKLIDQYELSPVIRLIERIPFRKSLERLVNSHALLLFAQGQPTQIPGKVFEYLRINKPIFAITEEGETKRLLEPFQNAFVANPKSIEEIQTKFKQMLAIIKNDNTSLDLAEKIKEYDRRYLTQKLAECLNKD